MDLDHEMPFIGSGQHLSFMLRTHDICCHDPIQGSQEQDPPTNWVLSKDPEKIGNCKDLTDVLDILTVWTLTDCMNLDKENYICHGMFH